MPSILQRYQSMSKLPGGKFIFAKLVGFSAPFFSNISPIFIDLRRAYCETQMRDRRGVRNHIGTINAGALCSMAEMTGGLALDTVVDNSLRWIPKTMTVQYVAKATGTITAISEFDPEIVVEGNVIIPIIVSNTSGEVVFTADITFYVSKKPSANAA
jgi:acyl-coenzyme A thioesterase PaaI-like protein